MRKDRPVQAKRSFLRRFLRIAGRGLLTVLIILLILFFLIQTPFVQNFVRGKAENYLSRKLKTRVRIGGLEVELFRSVTLRNVYIEDRQRDTLVSAGLIDVRMRLLGLLHNQLDIGRVHLEDLTAKIRRERPDSGFNFQFIIDAFARPVSPKPPENTSQPMKIDLKEVELDRIRFVFRDAVTGNDLAVWVGHSLTKVGKMDLDRLRFDVPEMELGGMEGWMRQESPGKAKDLGAVVTDVRVGRLVTVGGRLDLNRDIFQVREIQIDSTSLRFDDDRQKRQKAGMDYAHLGVTGFRLRAGDLQYTPDSISGTITAASLDEQSGFRLNRLQTVFFYSDHRAQLGGLLLETPGTLLQRSISLRYGSITGMVKNAAHTLVDLDLAGSRVQVRDILYFAPFLRSQPLFNRPGESWQIRARAKGSFDDLTVQTLQVSGIMDLRVDVEGRVLHPMDARRLQVDAQINRLSGSCDAVVGLLPKATIPGSINLPERFDLKGRLTGGINRVQTDLALSTSSGLVRLKGWAQDFRSTAGASYDIDVRTQALQLGRILQDSLQWGAVTAEIKVKGQGLDLRSANAQFSGRLDSATLRRYTYTGLTFDGTIADQEAQLRSAMDDAAVRFELQATADLTKKFPAIKLDWQVDTLDLRALHLVTDTLAFHGHIVADVVDADPDSLQGRLAMGGIRLVQGARLLKTDSVVLVATRNAGLEDIQVHSEMADLDWNGRYKVTEVVRALEHTIDRYFRLGITGDSAVAPQDWTMRLLLRPSPLLLAYIPSLKGTDTVGMLMRFNSEQEALQLQVMSPEVQLGSQRFDSPKWTVSTGGGGLNYDFQIAGGAGGGIELHRTWLVGTLRDNRLTSSLVLQDTHGKDRFRLAGELDKQTGGLRFVFNPDSLLLNYVAWQVSRDNYVRYDSAGVFVHDFLIHHDKDTLDINNATASPASPVNVRFTNFSLGTLGRMADQDSLLVDGMINGTVQLKNILSHPVFTSDLVIRQLSYKADTLGDLAVRVNNEKDSTFSADISLEGNNNDVRVKGDYITGQGRMNMQLKLGQLNLAAFSHVAEAEVENMKGYLEGQLAVSGTLDKPQLKGDIHFDSSAVTPVISGEPLRLSKDNIEFDEDGFNFSQFTLLDSSGNKLIVDGNVYTHDYRDFRFDISVNAANFRMVNAPEESSRQFYGLLDLDAAINLEGDVASPKVEGDVRVNKKTNFYFVLPGEDPEVVGREGVVRFVDHNRPGDTLVDRALLVARARETVIRGADISLNIQTDSSALLTMVIDERTGDILSTRGRSTLVFAMDRSGKTSLTGSYEVSSGTYNLSLDVLKRSFNIQKGSMITWTGDPLSATLDLTATYTAVTPSINLISNEIAGRPEADQNKFKEKLPFLVTLKMTGELMKPTITFDITLPPNILALWPDVDQRLTQIRGEESEMNKQVFALLLLNQFVGEDPLQSAAGGGTSVGSLAFQSASQILTNQLDQLAASMIKGVDIHFDLNNEQDYSTGSEIDYTEMDVTLSKKLFNERMQVSVGSGFDVVGVGAPNQNSTNLAGDVSVDYKLSNDGRYRLRAYRQNQYDEVVEGQVVETGVSFILTLDYNKLSDLFHRSEEDKLTERKTNKVVNTTPSNQ